MKSIWDIESNLKRKKNQFQAKLLVNRLLSNHQTFLLISWFQSMQHGTESGNGETKTCSVWGFVSNGYINGYGKTDTCNSLNIWLSVWASFSQQTFKIVRRPSPFTRSSTRNLHLLTVATICQPCRACMRLLYDKRDIEMWIECKYKTSVAHSTE